MFCSKFVEMRITRDIIVVIHYKLIIFGLPLYEPSNVMWDNQLVVNNTSLSQYTFGKEKNYSKLSHCTQ